MKVGSTGNERACSLLNLKEHVLSRIRQAGFGALLLAEEDAASSGIGLCAEIGFSDNALHFGKKPLDDLVRIGGSLSRISANLSGDITDRVLVEPDRIWLRFDVHFEHGMSRQEIHNMMTRSGGDSRLEWLKPVEPESRQSPGTDMISIARSRLDAVIELVDEVMACQATMVDKLGTHPSILSLDLAELKRASVALQEAVLSLSRARVAALFAELRRSRRLVADRPEIEIERVIFDRIAAALDAVLAVVPGDQPVQVKADGSGGFTWLRLDLPSPTREARHLCRAVEEMGGEGMLEDMGSLTLKLPRSIMLIDVMIGEVGDRAIEVSQLIEILGPPPDRIHRLDHRQRMLRFRDGLIPIVPLGACFGIEGRHIAPEQAVLIVVRAAGRIAALQIDAVRDQRQVRLQPIAGIAVPPGIKDIADGCLATGHGRGCPGDHVRARGRSWELGGTAVTRRIIA